MFCFLYQFLLNRPTYALRMFKFNLHVYAFSANFAAASVGKNISNTYIKKIISESCINQLGEVKNSNCWSFANCGSKVAALSGC